ncbi:MAG: DNA-binding response regulator [Chitinophagaceae bacterium]|nr:DNA-binding response regulator [Chitinophagaceae bacterium]MDB5222188.1 DNA-binding response regulator [Chitinophagaceae bacterium]
MNCLIIDDNKMARTAMKQLASQVEELTIVGECSSGLEAYNLMNSLAVDLLFLDIEMPGMTGIELTRNLVDKKPIIIFTTSKTEYAVDAFELKVADYIVKPVTLPRFLQAIEKATEIYNSNKTDVSVEETEFVFIRDNGVLKRLLIEDILFMEAMGDYVKVFTQQKFHAIHTTLKNVEEKLPPNKFLRVHRSYIVALNKIEKIEEGVIVINNKTIPVADAYRKILNKRLNIF